jgi:hypothetical protein
MRLSKLSGTGSSAARMTVATCWFFFECSMLMKVLTKACEIDNCTDALPMYRWDSKGLEKSPCLPEQQQQLMHWEQKPEGSIFPTPALKCKVKPCAEALSVQEGTVWRADAGTLGNLGMWADKCERPECDSHFAVRHPWDLGERVELLWNTTEENPILMDGSMRSFSV